MDENKLYEIVLDDFNINFVIEALSQAANNALIDGNLTAADRFNWCKADILEVFNYS